MADAVIDLPENDPAIDRAVKIIEENLIKEMPDCHVTSLHENDAGYAPLLQTVSYTHLTLPTTERV